MGTIQDFINTVEIIMKLIDKIKDRKTPELIQIQTLVLSLQTQFSFAQSENLKLQKKVIELEP